MYSLQLRRSSYSSPSKRRYWQTGQWNPSSPGGSNGCPSSRMPTICAASLCSTVIRREGLAAIPFQTIERAGSCASARSRSAGGGPVFGNDAGNFRLAWLNSGSAGPSDQRRRSITACVVPCDKFRPGCSATQLCRANQSRAPKRDIRRSKDGSARTPDRSSVDPVERH